MDYFNVIKKGLHGLIEYVITIILVFLGYAFLGMVPISLLQFYKIKTDQRIGSEEIAAFNQTLDFEVIHVGKNVGLLAMLMVFVISLLALWLGVRYIHRLPFKSLITPLEKVDVSKILFSFFLWTGIALVAEAISYAIQPEIYVMQFDALPFLGLFLISIFVIPLQTSFEELFFRGYLMPGIGLIFRNKWIPLLISSLLFASVHLMNPEIQEFGLEVMLLYYISAGLFLGIVTIWDNSLEVALGVHASVNVLSAMLITFEGSVLQTHALFRLTSANAWATLGIFLCSAIIFILVMKRKYKWNLNRINDSL